MLYERCFYNPFIINILHSIISVKRALFDTKMYLVSKRENNKNFKEHKLYTKTYYP